MKIYVSLGDHECEAYRDALRQRLEPAHEIIDAPDDAEILVFSPDSPIRDFTSLPNLKFVQSIWAGVDSIVKNDTLQVPLARLVDAGLEYGMREYVLGHVLADHIRIRSFEETREWDDRWLPLAQNKTVGIVGIGTLGQSCAEAARAIGFQVLGWSKSEKSVPYPSFTGQEGLNMLLAQSDYVVTLLPHTPYTENIINAQFFQNMRDDAMLINVGRGAILKEDDLIPALDSGELRRAVLDVFKIEPLPADHPFWQDDRILVTPHIAAKSRMESAVEVIIQNVELVSTDHEPLYLVDRKIGY